MFNNPSQFRRVFLLISSLALLLVCLLALAALVFLLPGLTAVAPTSTVAIIEMLTPTLPPTFTLPPSQTPTQTRPPRPSLTPTPVFTPTFTPSPTDTPTPTGLPTLTPARPQLLSGDYQLSDWTPEEADFMARLLEGYPQTLPAEARGEDDAAYYAAFEYARLALDEALLRFPEAQQVETWRWMLAYNLARLGQERAGAAYADLIAGALTRGETDLGQLYLWFQAREPRLALYMIELAPPSGYLGSFLVEVRGQGSAFIWLLQTPSGYQARPLLTHFDFVHGSQVRWIKADLNAQAGDGDELAFYFYLRPDRAQGIADFSLDAPLVFNLSQAQPRELPFLPQQDIFEMGTVYENLWAVQGTVSGQNDRVLVFDTFVFPACLVEVRLVFTWNGLYFARDGMQIEQLRTPLSLGYCRLIVDHAAGVWGPQAAASLMSPLLPDWPPAQDEQGKPFPLDAGDEWRFRLAVYQAMLGEREQAVAALTDLVGQPSIPLSRWIEPAQIFLDSYQQDLYQACLTTAYCDPSYVLAGMVASLPPGTDAMQFMWQSGPGVSASGYFDFDGDESPERWLTLRHRKFEKLQFWILAEYPQGIKALPVATVESNPPSLERLEAAYIGEDALDLQPAAFLDGRFSFTMRRLPDSLEPYLLPVPLRVEYPNRYLEGLWSAEHDLLAGVSPARVQEHLLALAEWPGLLCRPTWSCDPYYYLLGLASELAGDETKAVEVYHRLWSDYSQSPYTNMARLKLAGLPVLASPAPSPTATLASTPTPTSSAAAGTPSSTPTVTYTPTASGTPNTATPTTSGTPNTATPTATPTRTLTPTSPYP